MPVSKCVCSSENMIARFFLESGVVEVVTSGECWVPVLCWEYRVLYCAGAVTAAAAARSGPALPVP